MVNIWESGDLVLTVDGLSGDRQPLVASWEMPAATFRGMTSLAPPLDAAGSHAPRLIAITPDNLKMYGQIQVGVPTEFDDKYVYVPNSTPADVVIDRPSLNVNNNFGQAFDATGNRYFGDVEEDPDTGDDIVVIRKFGIDGSETMYPILDSDPNVNVVGLNVVRLFVNQAGTRAYWNQEPSNLSITTSFVGVNIYDLEHGTTIPYFDLTPYIPSATDLSDFAIGPVTGRIYLGYEGTGGFPFVAVIDPDTFEIITTYLAGNTHCVTHGLVINCDETLIAQVHSDVGINDIQIFDPDDGTPIAYINYIGDMGGRELIRGITFAPCPAVPPAGGVIAQATMVG